MFSHLDVAVVTSGKISLDPHTSGQELFLKTMIESLRFHGLNVELFDYTEFRRKILNGHHPSVVNLYYLTSKQMLNIHRLCKESALTYHVYHIDDATWSRLHSLRWRLFLITAQAFVDRYLATSKSVFNWLRRRVVTSHVLLVEPLMQCKYCKPTIDVHKKFNKLEELRLLYLGRLHPMRALLSDMFKISCTLSHVINRHVNLTVVSTSKTSVTIPKLSLGPLAKVEFVNRRLSEEEKCRLYRKSHIFLYLSRGNTAMNPPMTILEAVYHGVLPLVSPHVLQDLDIPSEFVVSDLDTGLDVIGDVLEEPNQLYKALYNRMRRFFDEERFWSQLKPFIK